jgi:hypothetical protein
MAENDCARFGMPGGAQILVAASYVGQEYTIGGRFGHLLSMPRVGAARQRDPGVAARP